MEFNKIRIAGKLFFFCVNYNKKQDSYYLMVLNSNYLVTIKNV